MLELLPQAAVRTTAPAVTQAAKIIGRNLLMLGSVEASLPTHDQPVTPPERLAAYNGTRRLRFAREDRDPTCIELPRIRFVLAARVDIDFVRNRHVPEARVLQDLRPLVVQE